MATEIFSGNSRYATDFQSVIDRSIAIASLPLQQLEISKTQLQDEKTALTNLETKFTAIQSALTSLESATGLSSYSSSVSNGGIVKATLGSGAMAGTYTVEVTSLGSFSNTMSKDTLADVSDPLTSSISNASTFILTVDGTQYTIAPSANTLTALADAINSAAGSSVSASIVNVGSSSAPDYRLSVQSKKLGAVSVQLSDGSTELLDTLATGSKASYKVNGLPANIESDSRTITLAPGLTIDLLAQSAPGEATTITVSRATSAVQSALGAFVSAYNAAVDELDQHRGESSSALAGHSILSTLSNSLRSISSYTSDTTKVPSLIDLGLTLGQDGKISLDTTQFLSLSANDVFQFLGAADQGGFLEAASSILQTVSDESTGMLTNEISSVESQIDHQDELIAQNQERIDQLRLSLNAQMAAADALIASLEQQANYMNSLFEAMRINSETMQ